ncbi:MAG: homoaconitase [bacterium]
MAQTYVEKIAQKCAVHLQPDQEVHAGDYLSIRPAYVMTHDNTGAVIPKFRAIGATAIAIPRQVVFTIDHDIQNKSEKNLQKYANIEAFAREHEIDFYPAGRGIGHQVMVEEGYAWPGTLAVASDSHSNMYGGIGCLGTPVVRTDAAAIWAAGRTWWQIPPIAKVELAGRLKPGVTGKDVIITLCGFFNHDEALNHIIEFVGDGVRHLSLDERLTIANMTTEWGALAGVFPVDEVTLDWLRQRAKDIQSRGLAGVPSDEDGDGAHPRMNSSRIQELQDQLSVLQADNDAYYAKELFLDLSSVQPHVSGPDTVKEMTSITEIRRRRVKIHKAYLLSCVNSRLEDLAVAAAMVRGKTVAPGVEFYIAAASSEVQSGSQQRGDWQALLDAGATPLPPGCGPCIGLGKGTLDQHEVGISATNRNFKGRMGSRSALAYLASPGVVAASAVAGFIDFPGEWGECATKGRVKVNERPRQQSTRIHILDGFPQSITGELIFCHQDNLNTDGIYPGKYTYIDDFTPEQQAEVAMENYDAQFKNVVREGDILACGFNFGSGSSREQAATALKYRGLALVVAGSFSETYKRNALNNGFLTIEAPELIQDLKARFGADELTVRTGIAATIDFTKAVLQADGKVYAISPVGAAAQELVLVGGLENWVKRSLAEISFLK